MNEDKPESEPEEELVFTREELVENEGDDIAEREDGFEKFRDIPVGTNDPNIVGEVAATDVPPGRD